MPPHSNAGNGNRSLLGAHQNGKGSAERSPGFRKNYDDIDFTQPSDGFVRVNRSRIRKIYGAAKSYPTIAGGDFDKIPGQTSVPTVPETGTCCGGDCGCGHSD